MNEALLLNMPCIVVLGATLIFAAVAFIRSMRGERLASQQADTPSADAAHESS
jgi:hypothetical protein